MWSNEDNRRKFDMFEVREYFMRSSHQRPPIKKAVHKNFGIITGKHLCWSLFLIKLQAF